MKIELNKNVFCELGSFELINLLEKTSGYFFKYLNFGGKSGANFASELTI